MDQIKSFFAKMNSLGVPLPLLRDPKTGQASLSLSLVVVSFCIVVLALVGKYGAGLKIDMPDALQLLWGTSALYFGRGFVGAKDKPAISDPQPPRP